MFGACVMEGRCVAPGTYPAEGGMCTHCLDLAAEQIRALPGLYVDLRHDLTPWPQRNDDSSGVTSPNKSASQPPVNMAVLHLAQQIATAAGIWDGMLRRHLGLPQRARYRMREATVAAQAPRFLADNVRSLAALPLVIGPFAGPDRPVLARSGLSAIKSLTGLCERARSVLGAVDVVVCLPGTCSACNSPQLRRQLGAMFISCGLCGSRALYSAYQRQVGLLTRQGLEWTPTGG